MIITLYTNCILTDAYSEVMDTFVKDDNNQTALDRYLASLSSRSYTVDNVYLTNTGKFTFELSETDGYNDFYHFNYIKVDDTDNNVTRYAFIENITIVNGLAVVQYIEDTWANYSSSMVIRNSLLSRSRIIDYGNYQIPYYTIGMDYESNEKPKLTCVSNNLEIGVDNIVKECNLVVTIQQYTLAESGETSMRQSHTFIVSAGATSDGAVTTYDKTAGTWLDYITALVMWSSSEKMYQGDVQTYYEIINAYLVPKEFNLVNISSTNSYGYINTPEVETTGGETIIPSYSFTFYDLYANSVNNKGALRLTTTYQNLPNNFKRIGVGTLTQPFEVVNNGTSIDVKIYCSVDEFNFGLYLGVQGQLHEITQSYLLAIPVSVQTADVTQQQKTARAVETLNGTLQVVGGIASIAGGAGAMGISNRMLQAGKARNQIGTEMSGTNAVIGNAYSIVGGASSVVRGITNIVTANLQMFTTNKGVAIQSNAVMNACYGLIDVTIVADNEVEVNAFLKESGYVCNEIVDNSLFTNITTGASNKFNVVMFDYVKLYGKFSQRTASVLREILTNGVKIWYDETSINE